MYLWLDGQAGTLSSVAAEVFRMILQEDCSHFDSC